MGIQITIWNHGSYFDEKVCVFLFVCLFYETESQVAQDDLNVTK